MTLSLWKCRKFGGGVRRNPVGESPDTCQRLWRIRRFRNLKLLHGFIDGRETLLLELVLETSTITNHRLVSCDPALELVEPGFPLEMLLWAGVKPMPVLDQSTVWTEGV